MLIQVQLSVVLKNFINDTNFTSVIYDRHLKYHLSNMIMIELNLSANCGLWHCNNQHTSIMLLNKNHKNLRDLQ